MSKLCQYKCKKCGKVILKFDDDNDDKAETLVKGLNECYKEAHLFSIELPHHNGLTIHGEAGFCCEGTVFDSTDTIHQLTSQIIREGEDERELKSYLAARRDA